MTSYSEMWKERDKERKVKHEEIRIWGQKFFSLSLIQKNEKACSEGDPGNVADKNYEYDSWTY